MALLCTPLANGIADQTRNSPRDEVQVWSERPQAWAEFNLGLGQPRSVSLEEEPTNTSPQGEGEIPAEARNCGGRFYFDVNALGVEFIPEPYNGDPMHIGAYGS